jgi:hypothetical protein
MLLGVVRVAIVEGQTRNRGPYTMIPGAFWLAAVVPLSGSQHGHSVLSSDSTGGAICGRPAVGSIHG